MSLGFNSLLNASNAADMRGGLGRDFILMNKDVEIAYFSVIEEDGFENIEVTKECCDYPSWLRPLDGFIRGRKAPKSRENMKDERGQVILKEDTPDDVLAVFEETEYIPDKYIERTYNYYKIKQVNGKAVLEEDTSLDKEDMFKAGEAVPLMFIQLELIPYEDLVLYGINK